VFDFKGSGSRPCRETNVEGHIFDYVKRCIWKHATTTTRKNQSQWYSDAFS
jgi:hypothetical protein